jgi:hypothetical protein
VSSSAPFIRQEARNAHADTQSPMSNARGGHPTETVTAIHTSAITMANAQTEWYHRQNAGENFEDRGAHELNVIPGEWRLYALEP